MLRAVLDANVFISAAIRPEGLPGQLLRLFLRDEAFELVISPAIGRVVDLHGYAPVTAVAALTPLAACAVLWFARATR